MDIFKILIIVGVIWLCLVVLIIILRHFDKQKKKASTASFEQHTIEKVENKSDPALIRSEQVYVPNDDTDIDKLLIQMHKLNFTMDSIRRILVVMAIPAFLFVVWLVIRIIMLIVIGYPAGIFSLDRLLGL